MHSLPSSIRHGVARAVDADPSSLEIVHDHSWGLTSTRVLEVRTALETLPRLIVKFAPEGNHHLYREIRAHTPGADGSPPPSDPLTSRGISPTPLLVDPLERILAFRYVDGVTGDSPEGEKQGGTSAAAFEEAGRILRLLHAEGAPNHGARAEAKARFFGDTDRIHVAMTQARVACGHCVYCGMP